MRVAYFQQQECSLSEFSQLVEVSLTQATVPLADQIEKNVPIYDVAGHRTKLEDPDQRKALMSEWADVLLSGPGVLVLRGAYTDTEVLDQATAIYDQIIAEEKDASGGGADHFAASGANDRIWNSLEKLCVASPEVFLRYFSNTAVAAVCEAWLGPNYQMTAQVNLVHPGGAAQLAHRDYHLGFQSAEISANYPAHVHDLSPVLTLQGGIAHCDIPVEGGPTKLLPFSQKYRAGYAAWRRDDFRAYFEDNYIQLPLEKGDALFFSPALFHAAGANSSADIHRMVNLLQISSAFGRAMETVDRRKMCKLLYPAAKAAVAASMLDPSEIRSVVAACAEGYSFPTNLDRDPPVGGLAPVTQQALFLQALEAGHTPDVFSADLDALVERQLAN